MSRRAGILEQLSELSERLRSEGIEFAAIGGVAVNIYGYPRAMRDLDLLINGSDADKAAHAWN